MSKSRARIYAERGVNTAWLDSVPVSFNAWNVTNPFTFGRDSVDGITIGYDESRKETPDETPDEKPKEKQGRWKGPRDLPLPLEAFLYHDVETRPAFLDLAQTNWLVSKKGGQYNLLGNNCFWFAFSSMKDHGLKHTSPPKKVYFDIGGGSGRLRDLYSYHITRRYKEYYRVIDYSNHNPTQLSS